ncbi:MAG: hypothetical protein ACYSRR_08275 [Planctomycetota bacterium]|jgi:hypothetical protein
MSFKNPKNLIVVVGVVAALMAGTVLLGGYVVGQSADTEAPVKTCQASDSKGCCPSMANSAAFATVSGDVPIATGCTKMPCTEGCQKPCCAEDSDGCCEKPCPIPCPKPCCAEDTPKGCCGTTKAKGGCAIEAAAQ